MNKDEFLRQLEQLLSGISEEERTDALAFYKGYFADAGEENEASVIAELESPQKVAESILKNLGMESNGSSYNSYTDRNAYRNANSDAEYGRNVNDTVNHMNGNVNAKKPGPGMTALLIVLLVLTSPLWLTLLLILFSVLLGAVCVVFGVAIAVVAVVAALVFTGIGLFGGGIAALSAGNAIVGTGLMGCGLIVLALGILAVVLMVWVFGVFLPWALKWIARLCRMLFKKGRECVGA